MALSRFILPFADVGSGIKPSDGAQLFFYETGTSTFKDTFTDASGTIPNANPVIANSSGVFGDIFITGTYKVVLQNKNDSQIWEADPVSSVSSSEYINQNFNRFGTLSSFVNDASLEEGTAARVTDRGDGIFDVVLASTVTPNTYSIVQCSGVPTLALVLRIDNRIDITQLGAVESGDNSGVLQFALDHAATFSPRKSIYIPSGAYPYATTLVWRTEVSVFGDGKRNSGLLWEGDDLVWAIESEATACNDLSMRDFYIRGPEFTATKKLLNLTKFRYSAFSNLLLADCLVCCITGDSWGCEYSHCSFVPRISSPGDSTTGCVCMWLEDGTLQTNATSWTNCRFQFAEVGVLIKSGGRGLVFDDANIFESLSVGVQLQDRFVHTLNITDNYFELIAEVPFKFIRTGMVGWVTGVHFSDNYIACNASEVGVCRISGSSVSNKSSIQIENNDIEFYAANQEPTSGYFLDIVNDSINCILTYNQVQIVGLFDNTEVYSHYDKNTVYMPTFTTNVPFELDYALDDQGVNKFGPLDTDVLLGYPSNGSMRVVGTATSATQVGIGIQVVATLPLSSYDGTSFSTFFSGVRGESVSQITQRSSGNVQITNIDSGNIAHIDFTYGMKDGPTIKNNVT